MVLHSVAVGKHHLGAGLHDGHIREEFLRLLGDLAGRLGGGRGGAVQRDERYDGVGHRCALAVLDGGGERGWCGGDPRRGGEHEQRKKEPGFHVPD